MPENNQSVFFVYIYFIKTLSRRVLCHMSKDNKKIFHFSFVFYVRDAFLSDSNKQQLEKKNQLATRLLIHSCFPVQYT